MTGVGIHSTARSETANRSLRRWGVPATLALALVTAITLTVAAFPRSASADQVSDLQTEAVQISQRLTEEQLQIGGFQQQYAQESAKVEQDQQAINQTEQQIDEDQQRSSTLSDCVLAVISPIAR